ncbi:hypothetical protein RRF57_006036 [Xylaria bambusicola]|uniref:Uncharacterized protein n=1 Tax=Xylaria bambusicola TaxID=326684 RepID=A0AAN7Z9L3_9PEZI
MFNVYFKPIPYKNYTYTINTYISREFFFRLALPITRELYLTPNRTIEPPAPRLLAIHYTIARILHLSGAGEYINKIYRNMEEYSMQEDGSTPLGRFVSLTINERCPSVILRN